MFRGIILACRTMPAIFTSGRKIIPMYIQVNTHHQQYSNLAESSRSCWKCQSNVNSSTDVFCNLCGVIQKPSNLINYFHLMGKEPSYNIDDKELSNKYKNLQKYLHPDKFTLKSKEEQDVAEEYSALVNHAYSTLRNPWLRGRYLLHLAGIDLDEVATIDDMDFLLKIMERNEKLAEATSLKDVKEIGEQNNADLTSSIKSVTDSFKGNDLEAVKVSLIKLKYFSNLDEKVGEKLFSLRDRA